VQARLDDAQPAATTQAAATAPAANGRLGLALRPLQPEERQLAGMQGGLFIEGVSGPAARAGVQAGDLLLAIDGLPVSTVAQASAAAGRIDKAVAILVQRAGMKLYLPLRPS
jgi:serine protease Do